MASSTPTPVSARRAVPTVVRTSPFTAAILALGFLAGCPDPKGSFQEFEGRVIDAAPIITTDAPPLEEIPDITGSYFVGFKLPENLPQDVYFRFIWDVVMTKNDDGTATVVLTVTSLNSTTNVKVGVPLTLAPSPVNSAGEFVLVFDGQVVPAAADPLELGDLVINMTANATIKSENGFCGIVPDGKVSFGNTSVDGTRFGAVRIPPGTEGAALPAPHFTCDDFVLPDGGLPQDDAGAPDAAVDAGVNDAAIDAA